MYRSIVLYICMFKKKERKIKRKKEKKKKRIIKMNGNTILKIKREGKKRKKRVGEKGRRSSQKHGPILYNGLRDLE